MLERLLDTMDCRSTPGDADALTARYLRAGGSLERLIDTLAHATVREDLDFHSLQHLMVGVTRNLAAQCPTRRGGLSTALIARRLHRGQALYADDEEENGGP